MGSIQNIYSFFFQVKSEGKRPNFLFGNVDFAHDDDEDDSDCEEYLVESEKAGSAGGESKTHAGMRNTVSGDSNFDIREGVRISDWWSQSRERSEISRHLCKLGFLCFLTKDYWT